jgi:hypothetical protein
MESILDTAWAFLNSPLGISMVVSAVGSLVAVIIAKVPFAKKWGGILIEAVKYAEKAIPDDTKNTGLKKIDIALEYALDRFAELGVKVKDKQLPEIVDGLSKAHDDAEAFDTLKPAKKE